MKYIVATIFFISSCCTVIKTTSNSSNTDKIDYGKKLDLMRNYRTSKDTINGEIITSYDDLHCKSVLKPNGDLILKFNNGKELSGNWSDYACQFEVFDSSYLFISVKQGVSTASGPDLFERDNVFIFDLKSGGLEKVSLPNIRLTRSKSFLIEGYRFQTEEYLSKAPFVYCAVQNVDLNSHKLTVINQNLKLVDFTTHVVKGLFEE